jgi:Xaa-Pro dipeptidase
MRSPVPELGALRARLADVGLAAAILTSYETVSPFAGTNILSQPRVAERLVFFVIPTAGRTTLLVCNIEEDEVRATTTADDLRSYVEFQEDPTTVLGDLLRELGLHASPVGLELRRLASSHVDALRRQLPCLEVHGVDDIVGDSVSVKTRAEADVLGRIARATQRAVEQAVAALDAERTERECLAEFLYRLVQTGGRPEFVVFGTGARTMQGHPTTRDARPEAGSIWRVDLGARYPDGYLSDLARTGVFGEPTAEQEEIMQAVLAAQRAAIDRAEPGRPAGELWRAAAASLARSGLEIWAPHLGHSIGVGLHERPSLDPANTTALVAGTVLNIEPIVVVREREEGYHTEDLVLVTDAGGELLTEPQAGLLRIARPDGGMKR